jgi:hypothetical protein
MTERFIVKGSSRVATARRVARPIRPNTPRGARLPADARGRDGGGSRAIGGGSRLLWGSAFYDIKAGNCVFFLCFSYRLHCIRIEPLPYGFLVWPLTHRNAIGR